MRHRIRLEDVVYSAIISTAILIFNVSDASYAVAQDQENTKEGKAFEKYADDILKDLDIQQEMLANAKASLVEKLKMIYQHGYRIGNETGFEIGYKPAFEIAYKTAFEIAYKTAFENGYKPAFQIGYKQGYQTGSEVHGYAAFHCAISVIKGTLERLTHQPELYSKKPWVTIAIQSEIRYWSNMFTQSDLAVINNTRDEWIHSSIISERNSTPNNPYDKPHFIHEIGYRFGQCMYLLHLDPRPPPAFQIMKKRLDSYFRNHFASTKSKMGFEKLEIEFCATVARSYYLANAVSRKYFETIMAVTQPKEGPKYYFNDALLEIIPYWYMRHEDITYLNIFKYAYYRVGHLEFKPLTPYYITNQWTGETGDDLPDLVVMPLQYNSAECGVIRRDKASSPPKGAVTCPLDVGVTPKPRKTTTTPPPESPEYYEY